MDKYCLLNEGKGEYEDRKSVFMAFAKSVDTEEAAKEFLEEIRHRFADANHHVYAYSVGNQYIRYSDDSEPQGTAGLPVLSMIQHYQLSNCIVVVIRYFGGTLLGTGGLSRAYGSSAKLALEDAGIAVLRSFSLLQYTSSYSDYQKLQSLSVRMGAEEVSVEYGTEVCGKWAILLDERDRFVSAVVESTNGRVMPGEYGVEERPMPIKE